MKDIKLIEDDQSGLGEELYGEAELEAAYQWIKQWGWGLTILFVVIWPLLSIPEGVFSKEYFAFWIFISLFWGFCAAAVIIVLPIYESWTSIMKVVSAVMREAADELDGTNAAKADAEEAKTTL
jgi:hypothetical protein